MLNSKPALLGTLRLYTYPDEALWQQLTLPEVLQRDEVAQTGHRVSGMTAFPEVLQRDEVAQTGHRVSGMTAFPV